MHEIQLLYYEHNFEFCTNNIHIITEKSYEFIGREKLELHKYSKFQIVVYKNKKYFVANIYKHNCGCNEIDLKEHNIYNMQRIREIGLCSKCRHLISNRDENNLEEFYCMLGEYKYKEIYACKKFNLLDKEVI